MKNNLKQIIFGITCFAIGVIVSMFLRPDQTLSSKHPYSMDSIVSLESGSDRAFKKSAQKFLFEPEQQLDSNKSQLKTNDGHDEIRVSADLVEKYWPPPLYDFDSGKFEFSSLLPYGLGFQETVKLQEMLNQKVDEISRLALDNSKLVTEQNGSQYFLISPFPEAGASLRTDLHAEIAGAFAGVLTERGKLLDLSLSRHPLFAGFGSDRIELAIEERSVDGVPEQNYTIKTFSQNGRLAGSRSMPLNSHYISEKFKALVQKHIK